MALRIFNTLGREIQDFTPISKGKVGIYCCGPTVYHYAHIGNLRTYIFEDILRRTLEYNNLEVTHVMNITDVGHLTSDADEGEDKMEKGAKREGKTVWEVAKFYEDAFFRDTDKLNILRPTITCRATEHIPEMIAMVEKLKANNHAYISNVGGNVYYDISTFPSYGKLANLDLDELTHKRVEEDENKRNNNDFVLWFTLKDSKYGESHSMKWDSPWGVGYPGWHIECSAMSTKYLGEQFDIHCGGVDHIPVHHTNEIAQSEGASKKVPCVNYWMHGEFLVVDEGKMSKSKDGFLTLSKLELDGFKPVHYRFFLLQSTYRKQLPFNYDNLNNAKIAFEKLKSKIIEIKKFPTSKNIASKEIYKNYFLDAINDDLNMPKALGVLNEVIKTDSLGGKEKLELMIEFDKIFGLDINGMQEEQIKVPKAIFDLAEQRKEAKQNKDWKLADELRNKIQEEGYIVSDSKDGYVISKK
ncbi:MAG: cysteine--tRNA ligase [Candidatus Woesearchaeota archaeon]|jgi:cysteinyl-tRNA synthetase